VIQLNKWSTEMWKNHFCKFNLQGIVKKVFHFYGGLTEDSFSKFDLKIFL
jgi:hypothetical protein